jgi:hypothetical protein
MAGRPWTAEELRRKSWDDLHTLWYKCLLERNIIATEAQDSRRQGIFFAIDDIHKERKSAVFSRLEIVLMAGQKDDGEDKVCFMGEISCLVGRSSTQ